MLFAVICALLIVIAYREKRFMDRETNLIRANAMLAQDNIELIEKNQQKAAQISRNSQQIGKLTAEVADLTLVRDRLEHDLQVSHELSADVRLGMEVDTGFFDTSSSRYRTTG